MGKRLNLFIRVFIAAFVISAGSLFFSWREDSVWLVSCVAIGMAVAMVAIVAASEKVVSMKTGLPLEDEFSRRATWKAGYYAFIIGLWLAIGIMFANLFAVEFLKLPEIEFRYAFEALIVVPALSFLVLAKWFRNKGNLG